ncbi:hypothetical protein [Frigoribacterium sp. UYMn621]|uniref:hypothetical protein n=1 Tax=Frigoribacterium sp. UYMn621 TaxID=3156343 RepID=UPI00339AF492
MSNSLSRRLISYLRDQGGQEKRLENGSVTKTSHKNEGRSSEVLLAEYSAANQVYLTYDGYRWQAGSFLIAGVFVYWGFLIQTSVSEWVMGTSSLLVAALMSCWLFFASHYRQLYLLKLRRLHEIELLLGMEQHLRFTTLSPSGFQYRARGIKGHHIDAVVYVITAVGGSVLAFAKSGFSLWGLAVLPLVVIVVLCVARNERVMKRDLGPLDRA